MSKEQMNTSSMTDEQRAIYDAGYRHGFMASKHDQGIGLPPNLAALWYANPHMPVEDVYMLAGLTKYRKARKDVSPAEWAMIYSVVQLVTVGTIEVVLNVAEVRT